MLKDQGPFLGSPLLVLPIYNSRVVFSKRQTDSTKRAAKGSSLACSLICVCCLRFESGKLTSFNIERLRP